MPEGSVEYHINIIHRQLSHLQTSPCRADRHSAAGAHDCALPLRHLRLNGGTTTQWHFSEGNVFPRKMADCQILAWLTETNYDAWTWNISLLYLRQSLTAYIAHTLTKCEDIAVLSVGECVNSLLCTVKTSGNSLGRDLKKMYWNQTNKDPPVVFCFSWWEGWG